MGYEEAKFAFTIFCYLLLKAKGRKQAKNVPDTPFPNKIESKHFQLFLQNKDFQEVKEEIQVICATVC